jgi:hypothetical protein
VYTAWQNLSTPIEANVIVAKSSLSLSTYRLRKGRSYAATAVSATVEVIYSCRCSGGYCWSDPLELSSRYSEISQLKFTKGSLGDLTRYFFGEKINPHYFCPVCGSGVLEAGTDDLKLFGVNIRCVEGIDLATLTYRDRDGASM